LQAFYFSNGGAGSGDVPRRGFVMFNPVELIKKKRNGDPLTREELDALIGGYVRGEVPEYQMAAFLMATYFRGMTPEEAGIFTDLMLRSGEMIDLSTVPGRKVDKHSTGGVGDKVSLILAPVVAACGVRVPMISGRGLGHTGGTLDKLEAIPGFRTRLDSATFRDILADVGAVLGGQTETIAPADRKMYALRDVTATVECIPLIGGSIMSKKLAEGIDALVLDVKTGDGAFMETEERALALARTLVDLGTQYGKRTVAFITAMDQPLGYAVGNWLEVLESVECLRGRQVRDLMEVTLVLAGAMVWLGEKAASIEEGMKLCQSAIWSGEAYEKFLAMVTRQGGDAHFLRDPATYPAAAVQVDVSSQFEGFVSGISVRTIGMLAIELGAGRMKIDDAVDPKAGVLLRKKLGDRVEVGEPLARLFTDDRSAADRVRRALGGCFALSPLPPVLPPRVSLMVDEAGVRPWVMPALL
jgi:pyrimidine-nucleoside phosphorylase